ncbi:hypothetical protein [Streptomyces sp. LN325]|uniref:hypothetical protein n=1 Tax=Streptomyces sp. LN325 TaxID=3112976 RepID=UPI00371A944A
MTRSPLPLSRAGAGRPKRPVAEWSTGGGRAHDHWHLSFARGGPRVGGGVLARSAVPVTLITVITLAATFAPVAVHLSPLLVAAPTSTAAFAGSRFTAGTALAASGAMFVIDRHDGLLHSPLLPLHIAALLVVSVFVVAARSLHDRDLRELSRYGRWRRWPSGSCCARCPGGSVRCASPVRTGRPRPTPWWAATCTPPPGPGARPASSSAMSAARACPP